MSCCKVYEIPFLLYIGTVVAMEKQAGILKEEHKAVVEALRDSLERDLQQYRGHTFSLMSVTVY